MVIKTANPINADLADLTRGEMMDQEKNAYSAKEVAIMCGMTDNAVRRKVRDKELSGEKIGLRLVVYNDKKFQKFLEIRQAYLKEIGNSSTETPSGRPSSLMSVAKEVSELRKEILELKVLIEGLLKKLSHKS